MGAIYSSLRNGITKLRCLLLFLTDVSEDFKRAIERAAESPCLPRPNPTPSYWLQDPPFPELTNIQSKPLPKHVDIAIIGSGITGASIARSILYERRRRHIDLDKIVAVFEARELCSGATARNGGHIKPSSYENFASWADIMPKERAAALTRFQTSHIDYLTELCEAEGIDAAEAREVETVDFYLDDDSYTEAVSKLEEYRKWVPELSVQNWDKDQVFEKFGVNEGVIGAITERSGAIWPYRFVVSIWKRLLDDFPSQLLIQTNTPILSIASSSSSSSSSSSPDFPYQLETKTGPLLARHVVHATNAFASHLNPGLRRKITGARGHMSAQRPGDMFPDAERGGQRSWGVLYKGGYDYVTQRPSPPPTSGGGGGGGVQGDLMLGGAFRRVTKSGVDQIGLYDDGAPPHPLAVAHIAGIFPSIFSPCCWGAGAEVKDVWTGILGMTGDHLPLVGRLDKSVTGRKGGKRAWSRGTTTTAVRPGEWLAAGFSGEGMVWAWLCGIALGIQVVGSEEEDIPKEPGSPAGKLKDWFPRELMISSARLRAADVTNLFHHV